MKNRTWNVVIVTCVAVTATVFGFIGATANDHEDLGKGPEYGVATSSARSMGMRHLVSLPESNTKVTGVAVELFSPKVDSKGNKLSCPKGYRPLLVETRGIFHFSGRISFPTRFDDDIVIFEAVNQRTTIFDNIKGSPLSDDVANAVFSLLQDKAVSEMQHGAKIPRLSFCNGGLPDQPIFVPYD